MIAAFSKDDQLLPVAQQAQRLTGSRPSPATVWRWAHKGVRGAKLTATSHSGRWLCSEADFRKFLREQTEARLARPATPETTDDALKAAGLL